jgi:hypothetical protein
MSNSPLPAWFSRFLASSVAAMVILPATSALHSKSAKVCAARRASPTLLESSCDGDAGSRAHCRVDREVVHQPLRAREAHAEAFARRPAIGHRQIHVGNSGTLVGEQQLEPAPSFTIHDFPMHGPAATVNDRVTRQFARGRHHLGLVDERELEILRELAHLLARGHDVVLRAQRRLAINVGCHLRRPRLSFDATTPCHARR